ncbi:glycosyltransferase family 2 protein [uncultured Campylobacter sp.]|uniref:GalNAc(5)-diNAcBac-PP-undecaprenol beta-1,3-glucosyltransferase n=1 Tax=uncultured Campylobacter sp. TaxID=218934 RepID=UPI002608DF83|nr:glycosyltransferase family 2 protein [uncultured Campylobacter sp.]
MKPFLSVLISTYNRSTLLQKAILSVLKQDFKDLEIIISDDNSSDDTKNVVNKLMAEDERIKFVTNTKYKKGPNGNKNNALDNASGEFVMFLDDDDELLDGATLSLVDKAKLGYSHIFGNCLIEENGKLKQEFSGKGLDKEQEVSKKDFLLGKFYGEFLSIFKRSLLDDKRFNDEFYGNEAVLWVNLYKEKSLYIHKALRIYRINRNDSVTKGAYNNANRVYLGYLELAKILEKELQSDKDYKKTCAIYYKMAAYYAKLAKMYKEMFYCIFKSIKISPNLPAFLLLLVSFLPNTIIAFLSKIRVRMKCKN